MKVILFHHQIIAIEITVHYLPQKFQTSVQAQSHQTPNNESISQSKGGHPRIRKTFYLLIKCILNFPGYSHQVTASFNQQELNVASTCCRLCYFEHNRLLGDAKTGKYHLTFAPPPKFIRKGRGKKERKGEDGKRKRENGEKKGKQK